MRKIIFCVTFCVIAGFALATNVSGYMTQSTTWTPNNNPYIVTGFLYILPGVTLTIMPDVQVLITAADKNDIHNFFWNGNTQPLGKSIIVQGCIKAFGTKRQPIVFDKYSHNPDAKWGVIHMAPGAPKSYFEHCVFRNSFFSFITPQVYYSSALNFMNGTIHLRHSLFESNYCAVSGIMQSDVLVYNCHFKSYNNISYPPPFALSHFIVIAGDQVNPPEQYRNLTIARCTFSGYAKYCYGYGYLNKLLLNNRFVDYHDYNNEPQRLNVNGIYSAYGNSVFESDIDFGCVVFSASDTAFCRRNTVYNYSPYCEATIGAGSSHIADGLGSAYLSDNSIFGYGFYRLSYPHRANVWCNNNYIETCENYAFLFNDHQNVFDGNVLIFNNVARRISSNSSKFIGTEMTTPKVFNNTAIGFNDYTSNLGGVYFTNNIFYNISQPPHGSTSGYTMLYTSNCLSAPFIGSLECDGGGNIVANPLFIDADSTNYQLSSESPCIDSGTSVPELPGYDARYYVRSMPSVAEGPRVVDMGAYEYNSVYIGGIEGFVYDAATNQALDCAKISISARLPEYSDSLGSFIYHTGAGTYTIKVSRWDYDDVVIPNVIVTRGQTLNLQIAMIPETTAIEGEANTPLPPAVTLYNYPNPFKTETTINFVIPHKSNISLDIYNLKGQKVKSLEYTEKAAGLHSIQWNGKDSKGTPCASGVYFCKMQYANKSVSKKLILMK